ncbi:phosphatase PAP2 family protein [Thermosynechococcus sichuanensis E542]|uniref:Phosphatase PAP2 family protein n=2 Tax=Thermosynechococcus TaxID=146785 RepID=A0A3B7MHL4_9CYAN|nr:phosphatase PAP2 family protein [Thermosynechococcus vestitus E542]
MSKMIRTVLPREFAPVAKLSYFSGNAPVAGSLVFISLMVLGRYHRWREMKAIAFSTLFILILIDRVLKPFFDVARPDNPLVLHLSGHSFPSGHAAGNLLLYFLWSYFLATKRPTLRGLSYGVAIALMILMGISSVYVGAHWVSDVLAGYCVGYAIYAVTVRYLERS